MSDIVCISHLPWNFVWQRPQQLLSRLSKQYRIFFVEEPRACSLDEQPHLDICQWQGQQGEQVTVLHLKYPMPEPRWIGHGDPLTTDIYNQLLEAYAVQEGIENPLMWLYTPMASPFIQTLTPRLLIYDVMDQLSAFKGAPIELAEEDLRVLQKADVVFTGGASLYQEKLPHNDNIYLFPSGVDVEHFALENQHPLPKELADLQGPIIGYFGVIDEHLDTDLLGYIARRHPEWNIVMIGPVIKITYEDLPRATNIHYLGMKLYSELPDYLAHFDVAILPFALNEATRYVSPTKVLEYLAAHKPIVSTAIHDVIEIYGSVVHVGHNHEEFVNHVEAALKAPRTPESWAQEDLVLRHNTWDAIAQNMAQIIACAIV